MSRRCYRSHLRPVQEVSGQARLRNVQNATQLTVGVSACQERKARFSYRGKACGDRDHHAVLRVGATRREAQTRVRTSDAEEDGGGRHCESLTKAAMAHGPEAYAKMAGTRPAIQINLDRRTAQVAGGRA